MHIYSPETYDETIFLEKEPDHYNSLIIKNSDARRVDLENINHHATVSEHNSPNSPSQTPTPPKTPPPPTNQRSRRQPKLTNKMAACIEIEKEKEKEKGRRKEPISNKLKKANTDEDSEPANKELYCSCKQVDDGSKMIECNECQVWYHTRCVGVGEAELKELNTQKKNYVCQSCCSKKEIKELYEKKLLIQKELYDNMKTTLNQRISDKNEEMRLLKRKEQQRKETELLEKNRLKLKVNKLVQDFKEKNVELTELKKNLKDNEVKMKSMEEKGSCNKANDNTQLKKANDEIRELKAALQSMKKEIKVCNVSSMYFLL